MKISLARMGCFSIADNISTFSVIGLTNLVPRILFRFFIRWWCRGGKYPKYKILLWRIRSARFNNWTIEHAFNCNMFVIYHIKTTSKKVLTLFMPGFFFRLFQLGGGGGTSAPLDKFWLETAMAMKIGTNITWQNTNKMVEKIVSNMAAIFADVIKTFSILTFLSIFFWKTDNF